MNFGDIFVITWDITTDLSISMYIYMYEYIYIHAHPPRTDQNSISTGIYEQNMFFLQPVKKRNGQ